MTKTLNLFVTPELCKKCIHYNSKEKTCVRSIVAKAVRYDPKRCGPDAKWFQEAEP